MTAFMYHILVDSYGSIPFTEAILGNENTTPKYDDSKTVVYPGLLAMLDEIIAKKCGSYRRWFAFGYKTRLGVRW